MPLEGTEADGLGGPVGPDAARQIERGLLEDVAEVGVKVAVAGETDEPLGVRRQLGAVVQLGTAVAVHRANPQPHPIGVLGHVGVHGPSLDLHARCDVDVVRRTEGQ